MNDKLINIVQSINVDYLLRPTVKTNQSAIILLPFSLVIVLLPLVCEFLNCSSQNFSKRFCKLSIAVYCVLHAPFIATLVKIFNPMNVLGLSKGQSARSWNQTARFRVCAAQSWDCANSCLARNIYTLQAEST